MKSLSTDFYLKLEVSLPLTLDIATIDKRFANNPIVLNTIATNLSGFKKTPFGWWFVSSFAE